MTILKDIVYLVLDYIYDEEKVELVSSCKEWYFTWMKPFVRKLKIRPDAVIDEELLTAVRQRIADPLDQLILTKFLTNDTTPILSFLSGFNFRLKELSCDESLFLQIIRSSEIFRIRNLTLTGLSFDNFASVQEFYDCFSKIADCETLSLSFQSPTETVTIPHLTLLKSLFLGNVSFLNDMQLLMDYRNTLQHLSLYACSISDVSMLDSIPKLELKSCHEIIDISSLKNNRQVLIEYCDRIQDFSYSFENCQVIDIQLSGQRDAYYFDLTRWKRVSTLKLAVLTYSVNFCFLHDNKSLPVTVQNCSLGGGFVSSIDFTITAHHLLKELHLINDNTITSLEDYGLEQVSSLEISCVDALQTLEGLGRGKNVKITISCCDYIDDFTPLSHTPIVEVNYCERFTDPLQLRFVRKLTLRPSKTISFRAHGVSNNPFESIQELCLPDTRHVKSLEGIESIPNVLFDEGGFRLMKSVLGKGRQLTNQRIVLIQRYLAISEPEVKELVSFMKEEYDCINRLPKRLVWIRK